jgi:zona occludens toxin (predicted ATPase)
MSAYNFCVTPKHQFLLRTWICLQMLLAALVFPMAEWRGSSAHDHSAQHAQEHQHDDAQAHAVHDDGHAAIAEHACDLEHHCIAHYFVGVLAGRYLMPAVQTQSHSFAHTHPRISVGAAQRIERPKWANA